MKIGIITLPLHTNYGGILQAYALQRVLKTLGHNVWLLNRKKTFKLTITQIPIRYLRRIIRKCVLRRKDAVIFLEKKRRKEYQVISVNTQKFIDQKITPSYTIDKFEDIPVNSFDAIVVGSDQIWRPRYVKPKIENAFLDFTKNWSALKRISYAASFGSSNWEYDRNTTRKCRELVQRFDAISVREDSAIKLCKKHFNVDTKLVLDPTMLLDMSEYIDLINCAEEDIRGDLFEYILDPGEDKNQIINLISKEFHYQPFSTSTDNSSVDLQKRIATSVELWLKSFFYSKFVVTDSFHASVFSILFNKPFYVIENVNRGSARFHSLLKMFELEHRLIRSEKELKLEDAFQIDWNKVNKILDEQKELSLKFLTESLNDC